MKNYYDIAIIGGGYSGLICSVILSQNCPKMKIALIEKNDRVGKKITATGNGRGNVSNTEISLNNYHGDNFEFAKYALEKYPLSALKHFYEKLGVLLTIEKNRVYPASLQANSLSDALRLNIQNKVDVFLNTNITNIKKTTDSFCLTAKNDVIYSNKVILAFGGSAAPNFGTDGSAYKLAENLGHSTTKTYPVLVQLCAEKESIRGLKGIKCDAQLKLFDGENEITEYRGDLLFNDAGISGNAVFYISSFCPQLSYPNIKVDFLPDYEQSFLESFLLNKVKLYPNYPPEELFNGIIHRQIGRVILKKFSHIKSFYDFSKNDISKIVQELKNYKIEITGTFGFASAQVTRGGLKTTEFSDCSFESKIVSGLYAVGEALDIDGDCGGYNMQWAFSSAMCAVEAVMRGFNGNN